MSAPALLADISGMVGTGLALLGCVFLLVGGIGLLRLGDFFARLHAGSIVDTLGAGLLLIGLMFHGGWSLASVKLGLILAFLLLTTPTAAHALAGAAHVMGMHPRATGPAADRPSAQGNGDHPPARNNGGSPSIR